MATKIKKKQGRPTKVEQIVRKIEDAKENMGRKAADSIEDLFDEVLLIAKMPVGQIPAASKMAAIKYVAEQAEGFYQESTEEDDIKPVEVSDEEDNFELLSTEFVEKDQTKTIN